MNTPKLTIREGGFYRTRDGRKVGPMRDHLGINAYPFDCDQTGQYYRADGVADDGVEYDLIAEWTDAAPTEGTLRELDVKPGDVVEFVRGLDGMYKIHIEKRMVGRKIGGVEFEGDNGFRADCCHTFRLVSRAPATDTDAAMIQRVMEASLRDKEDAIMHDMGRPPAVDLNRLSVPFGLLDEVYGAGTQAALKAHDGPVEVFSAHGWHVVDKPEWYSTATYRAAPQPKVETHTREAWLWNFNVTKWKPASSATPVTITYTTTNGAIDPASYRVEARP